MISFPFKRVFGITGAIRTGKDSVADFLVETRGFTRMAFADQIKEEFGISNADFEAAKIAGNIEELRKQLWAFSAEKKKKDPQYFISKVINKVKASDDSIIITDIRTPDELIALLHMELGPTMRFKRIYWVRGSTGGEFDENGCLAGSKLSKTVIANCMASIFPKYDVQVIFNEEKTGLYEFYQRLDQHFFYEDIKDLFKYSKPNMAMYIQQFEVRQRKKGIL